MNRLNLRDVRPVAAEVLGVCPTDARIPGLVSEAQERMMCRGKWVGSVCRYRFCTQASCVTLPRQIESVEAWALCSAPGMVRDKWYEYAGTGGLRSDTSGCGTVLLDRGTACSFNDMSGVASKINVLPTVAEAAGARILLQGYDENANWIRTQDAGAWVDGEYVAITGATARSTKTFTNLTGVQKPVTNGTVNLFEWPTSTQANLQQLAQYESDETLPIYRRYLIPGLSETSACCGATDACADKAVTLMAKLTHIPVFNDNDWLILGNRAAFKLMMMAIVKERKNLFEAAMAHEAKALAQLEYELSSYEGDGVVPVLRVQHPDLFGGGGIENIVSIRLA